MQFGFSIAGVIFLAMLFIPNVIWGQKLPDGYKELSQDENPVLLGFERVGEVAATICAAVFVSPSGYSLPWLYWLIACFGLMVLYEIAWIRYFKGGRKLQLMFSPLGIIPIPLASLPVVALALLGIWCQSPLTIVAAVILGIGHIGIHAGHLKALR